MITITIMCNSLEFDLQIDSRQKIRAAIDILVQKGMALVDVDRICIKSICQKKVVSINKTFREEGINSGDKLEVIGE